jgi:hypothetical protein
MGRIPRSDGLLSCLGRKTQELVLPRIGAALSNSVSPVSSSSDQQAVQRRPAREKPAEREQKREDPGEFKRADPPHLKVVPPADEPTDRGDRPPAMAPPGAAPSVAAAFLQLVTAIQRGKGSVLKWLGTQTYRANVGRQKKAGKARKGTMLDQKIE